MFNKKQLIDVIISALTQELEQAINAANDAHAAAVDDQSVAETQYDTLAIEASYLAEGQSKRVREFQQAIEAYKSLGISLDAPLDNPLMNSIDKDNFDPSAYIALGALVQLSADSKANHWFFIGPAAGGFRCQLAEKNITVITPQSPMGMALLGKQQDDDVEVMLGANKVTDYITRLE